MPVRSLSVPMAAPLGVAAVAAGGCAVVWLANPTVPGGILPVCPTKALLGIDCPGCGSLRMIYSLLHFDLAGALRYNALGLVAVGLLLWAFGAWTYGRLAGRQVRSWQHLRWAAPVALALTLVWFVVRNLGFEPFTALYV
jgi:Protein of unknown function (DUF2752)